MILIPAIDLKAGQCVRLRQGRMDDDTVFSNDPAAMAQRWRDEGARRLHLVDLNGAFVGKPVNGEAIAAICGACPDIPVQLGGGIRNEKTIEAYLNIGVNYCIIGTQAVREPDFVARACREFPGQIIVGLDAKEGLVAVNGWAEVTEYQVMELAKQFEDDGISAIIYTDIGCDGMLQGLNIDATVALAEAIETPVVASGGITDINDIQALCDAPSNNILGAITGRAIYEGTLDLAAGQKLADSIAGKG
jgi:phosphoribosylformimino-5-aminoimidazole carboxamide ribotide isomerase